MSGEYCGSGCGMCRQCNAPWDDNPPVEQPIVTGAAPYTRRKKPSRKAVGAVREKVSQRKDGLCECCGFRAGESMHERKPRSLGGEISVENSHWVCGSGTTGCHGFIQRHEIDMEKRGDGYIFIPKTKEAEKWMLPF